MTLVIDGQRHVLRLTLGALAELEAALETDTLVALVQRFEGNGFATGDVLALLQAGLSGGAVQPVARRPAAWADRRRADGRRARGGGIARAGLYVAGMSVGMDWRALMQVGLRGLGLSPDAFWALTPAELQLMLGDDRAQGPLLADGLEALMAAYPDNSEGNRT